MVLEKLAYHPSDQDKNGRRVSRFIQEALDALRDEEHNLIAMCDNAQTGLIQYYGVYPEIYGDTVTVAENNGYILKLAATEDLAIGGEEPKPRGYAEFTPRDLDPPRQNPCG